MKAYHKTLLHQLRLAVLQSSGRTALPEWLVENTAHPADPLQKWSFEDHEYQLGILQCTAPHTSVIKCAQSGVSELALRMALGLGSLYQGSNTIYSLPTTGFARKFTSLRVDPVIEASDALKQARSKDVDSTEMKKIGRSFYFFVGAQNMRQVISIPAKVLIRDEVDFCNQKVLTALESRLGHNKPDPITGLDTWVKMDFSTPTLPNYGIHKLYMEGSKCVYMCKHDVCGQWVSVAPVTDIILPGFDGSLLTLTKDDLDSSFVKVDKAFVKCRGCGQPISHANLATPGKRLWVPEHAELHKEKASFYVSPLDAPVINPVQKILRGIKQYESADDWINFGLGVATQSADSQVSEYVLKRGVKGDYREPAGYNMDGCFGGLDVGKLLHLTVLAPVEDKLHLVWAERIRQIVNEYGDDSASARALEVVNTGLSKIVVDSGPDITIPQKIIQGSLYGAAWACYFSRSVKNTEAYSLDPTDGSVTVDRTKTIDEFVKFINAGKLVLPAGFAETEIVVKHVLKLKRVKRVSETTGETMAAWISADDEDHFFFSLLYAFIAYKLARGAVGQSCPAPVSRLAGKVRMRR